MPTPRLSLDKRKAITDLKAKGLSHRDIADVVGVGVGTVSKVAHEYGPVEPEDSIEKYAAFHKYTFDELKAKFDKWIGDTEKPRKAKAPGKSSIKKNVVINDIHTPFHNEAALAQMIRDNRDADECWLAGDAMDLFSFSRYEKFAAPFSPVQEFQAGRALMRTLSENFSKVRVMHGNHDDRFIKWLVRDKAIPPAILEFFKLQDPNFLSPLSKVCSGLPNVEMMEPKKLDYAHFPFIHQIGDCVLSHAEKFSRIPNKAVGEVIHWLKSYCEPQGIVSPFRCVIQAHTHAAGKTWCDYGVVGIEAGCMAKVPDYAGDAKLRGSQRPSIIGYTVVYQENGKTDLNRTNFVQL